MIYHYLSIIQKSIDTFSNFYELNFFYNSIYANSFLNTMKKVNQNNIKNEKQSPNENNILKIWSSNMNREFDEKLRSDNFLNLLDKYINSSLGLFNNMYSNGYINPQLIYHDFIDLYLKYFSSFISYSKEL